MVLKISAKSKVMVLKISAKSKIMVLKCRFRIVVCVKQFEDDKLTSRLDDGMLRFIIENVSLRMAC